MAPRVNLPVTAYKAVIACVVVSLSPPTPICQAHPYPDPGQIFLTPIPSTYTSSPLDGMAKNFFIFYMDTQDHAIYHVWIHFSYLLIPEERKNHLV